MNLVTTLGLFVATAIAEIVGCYLPSLWLRGRAPIWVLVPAAVSLALFAWLLALHPTAAGRVYAAYGGRVRRHRDRVAVAGGRRAPDRVGHRRLARRGPGHGDDHVGPAVLREENRATMARS